MGHNEGHGTFNDITSTEPNIIRTEPNIRILYDAKRSEPIKVESEPRRIIHDTMGHNEGHGTFNDITSTEPNIIRTEPNIRILYDAKRSEPIKVESEPRRIIHDTMGHNEGHGKFYDITFTEPNIIRTEPNIITNGTMPENIIFSNDTMRTEPITVQTKPNRMMNDSIRTEVNRTFQDSMRTEPNTLSTEPRRRIPDAVCTEQNRILNGIFRNEKDIIRTTNNISTKPNKIADVTVNNVLKSSSVTSYLRRTLELPPMTAHQLYERYESMKQAPIPSASEQTPNTPEETKNFHHCDICGAIFDDYEQLVIHKDTHIIDIQPINQLVQF